MHAISPPAPPAVTWTDAFGAEMVAIGATATGRGGAAAPRWSGRPGLLPFAAAYPDRAFDLGIAEQHTVTSAAGLAMAGLHPVVCVYSTFLNRAFDQLLMDVALHRLPVTFVLDRAGITGSDGPSHHGMWDLTLLGTVPGVRVAAPRDGTQLCALLREAVDWADGPTVLRFPKASVGPALPAVDRIGDVDVLRAGASRDVLIVATGPLAGAALAAAADAGGRTASTPPWSIRAGSCRSRTTWSRSRPATTTVVTVEDNGVHGGFGSALAQALRGRLVLGRAYT